MTAIIFFSLESRLKVNVLFIGVINLQMIPVSGRTQMDTIFQLSP